MAPSKRFKTANWAPEATHSRSSSSSSSIEDPHYYRTYVPLSNLPTPPLTSASTTRQPSPEILLAGETVDPQLFGPATHLTNLIPSSTSLTSSSVPLVQSMLSRANLPLETIALAVCILDSLDSCFVSSFRKKCPLTPLTLSNPYSEPHIDAVHPELLVLAALMLAVKFVDDAQVNTGWYVREWGLNLWSCAQVNFCQMALMENIGWKLKPLWEEGIIAEALRDMNMAGREFHPEIMDDEDWVHNLDSEEKLMFPTPTASKAVLRYGNVITPADTPVNTPQSLIPVTTEHDSVEYNRF